MGVAFILNHSHIFLDMQKAQSKKITPLRCLTIYSNLSYVHKSATKHDVFEKTLYFENIYALLTKRGVKMAGYWRSSFLRFYGPRRIMIYYMAKDYANRISLLRDQRGQSRAGKIGPSYPLG